MFGCRCCDWPCLSRERARAKWDGLGEIVTVTVTRSPWRSGGALAVGAVVPGSFLRLPGAGMVQAGTCWEDCVGCRWRAWPPLWLWSGFCPILAGFGFGFSLPLSLPPSQPLLFLCFSMFAPSRPQPCVAGLCHPSAPRGVQVLGHLLGGEEPPLRL